MAVRLAPAMTTLTSDMGGLRKHEWRVAPGKQPADYRSRWRSAANRLAACARGA